MYPQRSLFLTRSSDMDAGKIAKNLNISDEEKDELVKSYGYVAPKERELLLTVDNGIDNLEQKQVPQINRQLRRIIKRKTRSSSKKKLDIKEEKKKKEEEDLEMVVLMNL